MVLVPVEIKGLRLRGPCPIHIWIDCSGGFSAVAGSDFRPSSFLPSTGLLGFLHSPSFFPFTPPSLQHSVRIIWRVGLSWHEMGLTKETISLRNTPLLSAQFTFFFERQLLHVIFILIWFHFSPTLKAQSENLITVRIAAKKNMTDGK